MFIIIAFRIVGWGLLSLITFFQWELPQKALAKALDDWDEYWNPSNSSNSYKHAYVNGSRSKTHAQKTSVSQAATSSSHKSAQETTSEADSLDNAEISSEGTTNSTSESEPINQEQTTTPADEMELGTKTQEATGMLQQAIKIIKEQGEAAFLEAVKANDQLAKIVFEGLWQEKDALLPNLFRNPLRDKQPCDIDHTLRLVALMLSPNGFVNFFGKPATEVGKFFLNAKFDANLYGSLTSDEIVLLHQRLILLSFSSQLQLWNKTKFLKHWSGPFIEHVAENANSVTISLKGMRDLRNTVIGLFVKLAEKIDTLKPWFKHVHKYAQSYGNDDFYKVIETNAVAGVKLIELNLFEPNYILEYLKDHPEHCARVAQKTAEGIIFRPNDERQYELLRPFVDNVMLNEEAPYPIYRAVVNALLINWADKLPASKKATLEQIKRNNFAVASNESRVDFPEVSEAAKTAYFTELPDEYMAEEYEGRELVEQWLSDRKQLAQLFERGGRACDNYDFDAIKEVTQELKTSYRAFATRYHPDKVAANCREFATFAFKEVGSAIQKFKQKSDIELRTQPTDPIATGDDEVQQRRVDENTRACAAAQAELERLEKEVETILAKELPTQEEVLKKVRKNGKRKNGRNHRTDTQQRSESTLHAYQALCEKHDDAKIAAELKALGINLDDSDDEHVSNGLDGTTAAQAMRT